MDEHEVMRAGLVTATRMGITVSGLARLLGNDDRLAAYCPACTRWQALDLPRLVTEGHGPRRLEAFKTPCTHCCGDAIVRVAPRFGPSATHAPPPGSGAIS